MNELEKQLMRAAKEGEDEAVRLLIDQRVNVNVRDENEATPLMYAAGNYHREVIRSLIQNGADVNAKDKKDNTALMYFCSDIGDDPDNEETFTALFAPPHNGGNVNAQNKQGATALHLCMYSGNAQIAENLLFAGASPNIKDEEGLTPLMLAFDKKYNGMKELITAFINAGAEVDAKDKNGMTVLMRSALYDDIEVMKKVLIYGARAANQIDVNAVDHEGDTALILAAKAGHQDSAAYKIRALLLEGADINHKNNDEKTALDIAKDIEKDMAKEGGHEGVVQALEESSKSILRKSLEGVDLEKAIAEIADSISKPDSPEGQEGKRRKISKKGRGV